MATNAVACIPAYIVKRFAPLTEMTGNGNKYAFQSEEMEATNDEVVAFEEGNGSDKKDDNANERTEQRESRKLTTDTSKNIQMANS